MSCGCHRWTVIRTLTAVEPAEVSGASIEYIEDGQTKELHSGRFLRAFLKR